MGLTILILLVAPSAALGFGLGYTLGYQSVNRLKTHLARFHQISADAVGW
jgi:hypothetical protein